MLDTSKILYSYNDVMIKPATISKISSRSECNPYLADGKLPIFTAPMSTVVNLENRGVFEDNHINTIIPRNIDFKNRYEHAINGNWAAFSLNEFIENFCNSVNVNNTKIIWKVLVDIANGHMEKLYDAVKEAKKINGENIQIMVGNIANPETYRIAYESGVDFIRVSIGSGCGCITSTSVSIHYPMASLLDEIYKVKQNIIKELEENARFKFVYPLDANSFDFCDIHMFGYELQYDHEKAKEWIDNEIKKLPKIIADGGVRNYSDVIKGLALGADYVMIGGLFASLEESAGRIISIKGELHKEFYGMASRDGQIAINGEKTKTSEGTKKFLPIIGTISQWTENMADYLKSAMSYCDIKDIKNFNANNVNTILISNNTKNSINK